MKFKKIVYRRNHRSFEQRIDNSNAQSGFGNIIIPTDVIRDVYIDRFRRYGYVTILTDFNDYLRDVLCPEHLIGKIKFPEQPGERGTLLSWEKMSLSGNYIVTGTYLNSNNVKFYKEGVDFDDISNGTSNISITKNVLNDDCSYIIRAHAEKSTKGVIKLVTSGFGEIAQLCLKNNGNLQIDVSDTFKALIEKQFNIQINTEEGKEKKFNISQEGGLRYDDIENESYLEIKEKLIEVENEMIKLGKDAEEKMVLGDTLKDLLIRILDAIKLITVPTAMGPSGTPINQAQFTSLINELNNEVILSKKNYVE